MGVEYKDVIIAEKTDAQEGSVRNQFKYFNSEHEHWRYKDSSGDVWSWDPTNRNVYTHNETPTGTTQYTIGVGHYNLIRITGLDVNDYTTIYPQMDDTSRSKWLVLSNETANSCTINLNLAGTETLTLNGGDVYLLVWADDIWVRVQLGSVDFLKADGSIALTAEWNNPARLISAGGFATTGWPSSPGVTLSFDDGTRTVTVTDGGSAYYYINGTKYTLGGNHSVVFSDTEGMWFIYFDGDTLTASQTPWDIRANDVALVAYLYWDATNSEIIIFGYELHGYEMDAATHERLHDGGGAAWDTGLAVSETGTEEINVSAGEFHDEDIEVSITDGAGGSTWEQVLSPAELPIYYRDGAANWRILETADKNNATDVGYVDGSNDLKYNEYTGSVYQLTTVGNNDRMCMYVVASNDMSTPVALIMGQEEYNTTVQAEAEVFSSLNLAGFPAQELVVLARIVLKDTNSSKYYTIESITDLRAFNAQGNVTSPLIASHLSLSDLNTTNYYHLTEANHTLLTTAVIADSLHNHAKLYASDNSAVALETDASGNVGIHTAPAETLDVRAATPVLQVKATTSNATLRLDALSTTHNSIIQFYRGGASKGSINYEHNATGASEQMRFIVNGSERVTINGAGNLGIGSHVANYSVHARGTAPVFASQRSSATTAAGQEYGAYRFYASDDDLLGGLYAIADSSDNDSMKLEFKIKKSGGAAFTAASIHSGGALNAQKQFRMSNEYEWTTDADLTLDFDTNPVTSVRAEGPFTTSRTLDISGTGAAGDVLIVKNEDSSYWITIEAGTDPADGADVYGDEMIILHKDADGKWWQVGY